MLSPQLEQQLAGTVQQTETGATIALEAGVTTRLLQRVAAQMERMASAGHQPIVLCSSRIRLAFRKLTERSLPNLTVLAFSEIPAGVEVQSSGLLDME